MRLYLIKLLVNRLFCCNSGKGLAISNKRSPISKKDTGQARIACFIAFISSISQVIYPCYNKFVKCVSYTLISTKITCLVLTYALFTVKNLGRGYYE